jgi:hypothetical protein
MIERRDVCRGLPPAFVRPGSSRSSWAHRSGPHILIAVRHSQEPPPAQYTCFIAPSGVQALGSLAEGAGLVVAVSRFHPFQLRKADAFQSR